MLVKRQALREKQLAESAKERERIEAEVEALEKLKRQKEEEELGE